MEIKEYTCKQYFKEDITLEVRKYLETKTKTTYKKLWNIANQF